MDKILQARQLRRAIELFAQSVSDESAIMEIAAVYPAWRPANRAYKTGEIVQYGVNAYGETQLYRCAAPGHVSQLDWAPGTVPALWTAIGFTADNIPIWAQPLGASDAYAKDDRVSHNGVIYVSAVDGNVWEPGVYGWEAET